MSGTLYVVGTPIGNLGDVTERARETLRHVDLIAAEDTRRTGRLLEALDIDGRMLSLFEGNERSRTDRIVVALREGKDVALVSDAGMPAVSDPGFLLVRTCVELEIPIRVVPGPSAVVAALVVSGLPTDRWVFEGFLPRKAGERRERLRALRHDPRTVVLFESPNRIATLLRDALVELGDRRAALARELTKLHEQVVRGRTSEVLATIGDGDVKGEVVLVLEGATEPETPDLDELAAEALVLVEAGMRKRPAASEVARRYGVSANDVYDAVLRSERPEGAGPPTIGT